MNLIIGHSLAGPVEMPRCLVEILFKRQAACVQLPVFQSPARHARLILQCNSTSSEVTQRLPPALTSALLLWLFAARVRELCHVRTSSKFLPSSVWGVGEGGVSIRSTSQLTLHTVGGYSVRDDREQIQPDPDGCHISVIKACHASSCILCLNSASFA